MPDGGAACEDSSLVEMATSLFPSIVYGAREMAGMSMFAAAHQLAATAHRKRLREPR